MRNWIFYAIAAAVAVLPVGWILAGVLEALSYDMLPVQLHRPLYQSGDHVFGAVTASVFAFISVILVGAGRTRRAGK